MFCSPFIKSEVVQIRHSNSMSWLSGKKKLDSCVFIDQQCYKMHEVAWLFYMDIYDTVTIYWP